MNKVAIYCRLSDEDRDKINSSDDSESIQNQKNLLMKYAIEQEWDIYKIYSDDDFSGLDSSRPEFNQMISDAELGKFNIVLCKNQKRFTRDMGLVEKYLHRKFIEWGVRFVGLTDNADTSIRGNKKQRQINGLVNEWYCEDISEDIRAVFDMKRQEGQFIGAFACYGYKKDPKNKNRLIIDDEVAQVIRKIYDLCLEGYGASRIAAILSGEGIINPTNYKRKKGFNYINRNNNETYELWSDSTVRNILKNEMYIGNMVQGTSRKVSYKSKKVKSVPKKDWFIVRGTHEPIIDKEIFEEVQKRINKRIRSTKTGKPHVLASKVRCLDCGSSMHKVTNYIKKTRYQYLRCSLYTKAPEEGICTIHSIRLDNLKEIVADRLKEHMNTYLNEDYITTKLQLETCVNKETDKLKKELRQVESKLNQSSQVLKSLYLDKIQKNITDEQFQELNSVFLKDKEIFIKRKNELEQEIGEIDNSADNTDKWLAIIEQHKNFDKLTHDIVNRFIDYVEIGEKDKKSKQQRIKIYWKF